MSSEILAVVEATPVRRVMGAGMLAVMGALLLYLAMNTAPALGGLAILMITGTGALWLAVRLWQATQDRVELTEEVLRTGSGRVIARVADIESVDRGFFAFKPSNGFVLRLNTKAGRAWCPGLWWRTGRRVGIGGVTPGAQGKGMADLLSGMIAMRKQDAGGGEG